MIHFNPLLLFWLYIKNFSLEIKVPLLKLLIGILFLLILIWIYLKFNLIPEYKTEIVSLKIYHSEDIEPDVQFDININLSTKYHSDETLSAVSIDFHSRKDSAFQKSTLDGKIGIKETLLCYHAQHLIDSLRSIAKIYQADSTKFVSEMTIRQSIVKPYKVFHIQNNFDHVYDFKDHFLSGELINVKYEPKEGINYLYARFHYLVSGIVRGALCFGGPNSNSYGGIFSLYDISQAYVYFKLDKADYFNFNNITKLNFNFCSACEFCGVERYNPYVTMNGISITKNEIDKFDSISFHVKSLEAQNLQTVRLFVVTTLISFLITYISACIFNIVRIKSKRFVPKLVYKSGYYYWAVFDKKNNDFSRFPFHKKYESKEICQLEINENNKKYKKLFKKLSSKKTDRNIY